MFLGRITDNGDKDRIFLENDASVVARNLESGEGIKYFFIKLTPAATVLKPVTIKAGVRTNAPAREVVEIEADGSVLGSAEVTK